MERSKREDVMESGLLHCGSPFPHPDGLITSEYILLLTIHIQIRVESETSPNSHNPSMPAKLCHLETLEMNAQPLILRLRLVLGMNL